MDTDVWTVLLLLLVVPWVAVSVPLAVVLGRSVRLADERATGTGAGGALSPAALTGAR